MKYKIIFTSLLVVFIAVYILNLTDRSAKHVVREEDHEASQHRLLDEIETFNKDLYSLNAMQQFDVATVDVITPYQANQSEFFAENLIAGYWSREACQLDNQTHKDEYGPKYGVRTKKSVYDPEHNSLYVLSMTGEVFYCDNLMHQRGLVKTNPKVIVEPNSFAGLNKADGTFVLVGAIFSNASNGNMYYSDDRGISWHKSGNAELRQVYWVAETETREIIMACRSSDGMQIKRSKDYGETFELLHQIGNDYSYNNVYACRVYNTADMFTVLVKQNSTKKYWQFVYENGNLSQKDMLPDLKFKGRLHGSKLGEQITFAFLQSTTSFNLPLYDGNWNKRANITVEQDGGPGYILPFDHDVIMSRWTTPRFYDFQQGEWIKFKSRSIGYDIHDMQFFKKKNGKTLMVNNSDIGIRFNEVESLEDIRDEASPFSRLDYIHYYAQLHGGDAHPNGLLIGAYQDQGAELLVKQGNGVYKAVKLVGPDGLETQINKDGTASWMRFYWQQVFYSRHEGGVKGITKSANVDLGMNWYTPRFCLTYVDGEEAIYMGGKDKIIKVEYIPGMSNLQVSQLPNQFPAKISTVVAAESDPNRMYCCTIDGHFYYSNNRGITWTESDYTKAYPLLVSTQKHGGSAGVAIEVPKDHPDWVYFSNNTSGLRGRCILSTDGGNTFRDMFAGLESVYPVRDISVSADGELAFSSTYHVFIKSKEKWFPIAGLNMFSGAATAKNVVYLEDQNKVHFFTNSAGVVTFNITQDLTSVKDVAKKGDLKMLPNPVSRVLNIKTNDLIQEITVYDISGKLVMKRKGDSPVLNMENLRSGNYIVKVKTDNQVVSKKIQKY